MQVFTRFHSTLASHEFPQIGQITASIGVARICSQDFPATVIADADAALYYAKDHGRNRVCNYRDLLESGALQAHLAEGEIEIF